MAEALELARLAVADGTGTLLATSHVRDVRVDTVPQRVEEVRAALRAEGIALEVLGSAEVAWDDLATMDDRRLELIAQGPPGRRWVLLETPLMPGSEADWRAAAGRLRERGFAALVGHPERTSGLWRDGGLDLGRLDGAPVQVNASSLTGRHGPSARDRALAIASSDREVVIASDAHRPTRGPSLTAAVAVLVGEGVDPATAERMTSEAPRRLLEDGIAVGP
jgi:tyrosine-protein phosphatase YwqE